MGYTLYRKNGKVENFTRVEMIKHLIDGGWTIKREDLPKSLSKSRREEMDFFVRYKIMYAVI
jgi:hypothetical protein